MTANIVFMGFGEAGQAFASGIRDHAPGIAAFDLALEQAAAAGPLRAKMQGLGVAPVALADLAAAEVVFCLVTADQALVAAQIAAPHLAPGALWLDGNSCSPGTKRQASAVIVAAGGRYVDLAIMAPVNPKRHRTPLLLSGPEAGAAAAFLTGLDMQASVAGPVVGQASTIKMLRSVIIKGFEALTAEAFLAARTVGVEGAVIASLQKSDPGVDWAARGAYNLERMLVHGARRAAEMQEVAVTLRELGMPDHMARATIPWQSALAALALDPGPDDLGQRADLILTALR